jgi:aspartyl-tRNA(Asn)/glutamyl-tRNA(Gln) amidotransferase subunit B
MEYEPTIGIETHAQLLTKSKMFCRCATLSSLQQEDPSQAAVAPNSLVCPVCLGMPGALPVINRKAVEQVIMAGLALNCQIPEISRFDRKNYNYPDLVKGYQISQLHLPLCRDGWVDIEVDGNAKRIGIHDVHLEEDTGKLMHVRGYSLIDYNRSGIPLMEIVTEPDLTSVVQAREYVLKLRRIMRYLGVSSGNMEEGAMRFEANISLHPVGTAMKGKRVEVKNLNSFKALLRSLEYEIGRQSEVLHRGGTVARETRGWNETDGVTFSQRRKEMADDYRYFPEPDLPPLVITRDWVEQIRAGMPESPDARYRRIMDEYQLPSYDARLLTDERAVADYFEEAAAEGCSKNLSPKTIGNWITGELFRLLHARNADISASPVSPQRLVELIALVETGVVTGSAGKRVLEMMFDSGRTARDIVNQEGLAQISDAEQLRPVIEQVIGAHTDVVSQYRAGKETVLRFLVGQVMKATRGKANPELATSLLQERLRAR